MELARRALEAYQRRDADALHAVSHEHCELFTLTEGAAEGEAFRGHAGIDQWLAQELDPWDEFRVEPSEIHDLGDQVLVRYQVTARGKGSSARLTADSGSVFDFFDATILLVRSYLDWNEAVEAVGLRE